MRKMGENRDVIIFCKGKIGEGIKLGLPLLKKKFRFEAK